MILVTGGTGLVGSHLLFELVKQGKSVKAIYRSEQRLDLTQQVFKYKGDSTLEAYSKIKWVQADILDVNALKTAFHEVSTVYHTAALISFDPSKYRRLRKINIEGTANIVNLCIANGVTKLCYVSSIAVLGKSINNEPVTEDSHWNPDAENSVYGITKYGAEMEVWRGTQEGLPAVIVNPGFIMGPTFFKRGSGAIYRQVKKGLRYYPPGGTGVIHIDRVISTMIALMDSSIINERFILVDRNISYQQLLEEAAKEVGAIPPKKALRWWQLKLFARLDWIRSLFTGGRRRLTLTSARTLMTREYFDSGKINSLMERFSG